MASEPEWRCFLACELTPEVRQALIPAIDALKALGTSVRGSPADGMHLTLHFLGNVSASTVEPLAAALRPCVEKAAPFAVLIEKVDAFPTRRHPQVLFAAVGGPGLEPLAGLHRDTGAVIARAGLPVEQRAFRPHLTLGRVRPPLRPESRRALAGFLDRWAATSFGQLPIDAVHLYRSQLGKGPPQHTILFSFRLGKSEVRPGGFEPPHPGP